CLRRVEEIEMASAATKDYARFINGEEAQRSGFGKDMSMYAKEDYTRIKHVMAELTGTAYSDEENDSS
ncbi:MAG: hypothetical protein ACRDFS_01375, partial [Chloroflexota bacterium]